MDSCILVGTVNNVSKKLEKDLLVVLQAFSFFGEVKIFLVESDSSDATREILDGLSNRYRNFHYISLGQLRDKIPDRIERIRHCRNRYVDYIRSFDEISLPNYVVVADLDGMNGKLTESAVQSCFSRTDWDGVFANQRGGYYDILALRHELWQPNDYNEELEWFRSLVIPARQGLPRFYEHIRMRLEYDRARKQAIYRKMIRLNASQPWIDVDSGFGGIAIYKSSVFLRYDYSLVDKSKSGENEHVTLHSKMRSDGLRLWINPGFINTYWNTYNLNRYFLIRQVRQVIWNSPKLLKTIRLFRKN